MLKDKIKIRNLSAHKDERGRLAKLFDCPELKNKSIQDIYVTYTKIGQSRADHYHKKTTEWFCALKGKALINLKDIKTGEEIEITLDSSDMKILEIPPEISHRVFSIGDDELIMIAFGNQPYTKEDTDTYSKIIN